ncbi:MAG: ABC transporter ATP-binding protein [Lachnospiraceae bacterium]|nr:ABC transporter ATP-binding protein [Lachnospiraceae bacterium]
MISCRDIRKSFDRKEVLRGISFEIPAGSIFGLLGPSGAGKTTLIRILTGQLPCDSGTVTVFDKAPEAFTGADRKKFGIMMDSFGVYERFSCGENLAVFADLYGVPRSGIRDILSEVGLGDAYGKQASDLSKGMRARLQLARAFMHTPEIIFLDEPTGGLDPQTMRGIHRIILDKKKRGYTIFLTTHNMEEASKLCDRVALLHEGRIIEEGRPEEICRRYDHQKRIRLHLSDGEDMEMERGADAADGIASLLREGRVETIHSTEPSLESVFLELTGRKLEEDE